MKKVLSPLSHCAEPVPQTRVGAEQLARALCLLGCLVVWEFNSLVIMIDWHKLFSNAEAVLEFPWLECMNTLFVLCKELRSLTY